MIRTGTRFLPLAAAVLPAVTLTTVLASSTPASAASPSCGHGYAQLGTRPIYAASKVRGYLKVYYNSSNGYNCALAIRKGSTSLYSIKLKLCVYNTAQTKYGNCKYDGYKKRNHWYSGPLYVWARHRCLYVYASINTTNSDSVNKGEVIGTKVYCG